MSVNVSQQRVSLCKPTTKIFKRRESILTVNVHEDTVDQETFITDKFLSVLYSDEN